MMILRSALVAFALAVTPAIGLAQEAPVMVPSAQSAPVAASTELPAAPVVAGTIPTAGVGQPIDGGMGLQVQVTPDGQQARWMHDVLLLPIITAISLFVLGLLGWVAFRFRRAANPVASKTSHNTVIEIVWTLVPVIILVVISIPSIQLLAQQYKPAGKGAITVKATGNQWYWSYNYPDYGDFEVVANMLKEKADVVPGERSRTDADGPRLLAVDNRILIPVNTPIKLQTTSNDVIHSWAMPAFWSKMDAVPGRLNEIKFTAEREGVYFGQCSELCGARHGFMPIAVEVVSKAKFEAWIASKGGTIPGAAKPVAAVPAVAPGAAPELPKIEPLLPPAPVASSTPAAIK